MVKYEYGVQCVCISKSQTCGQPCTVMGMAAWCWGRDTLMGTAGVRVWTVGAGGSTDTTCCSPSTAGAQPELVINYILSCWFFFLNHTDVIRNSLQVWIYEKWVLCYPALSRMTMIYLHHPLCSGALWGCPGCCWHQVALQLQPRPHRFCIRSSHQLLKRLKTHRLLLLALEWFHGQTSQWPAQRSGFKSKRTQMQRRPLLFFEFVLKM